MKTTATITSLLFFAFLFELGEKDKPTTLVFPPFLHIWVQKATDTHLRLYTRGKAKVRNPEGVAATRLASWENPKDAGDDDELTVYGVNAGYNMIIYNTSMTSLSFYGINEKGAKKLKQPHGITAHAGGDVYVADTGNDRVVHFFNPGKELRLVRALSELSAPRDVVMSHDRTVYVADTGNDRIVVYRDDEPLMSWGDDGVLVQPSAVAATDPSDRWAYYKDSFVVVVDSLGNRIQKFTPYGERLKRFSFSEIDKPNADAGYLAIDYYSNIYVTDRTNHCIHKFDRDLNYLTCFGHKGGGDREFERPNGIAIYKRFGQVIVTEKKAVQYYWVGTDVLDFNVSKSENPRAVQVEYFLTEPSYVTLEIFDQDKHLIASPMKETIRFSGRREEWLGSDWQPIDLTSANQKNILEFDEALVKPGEYVFRMTIKPTYSSKEHFEKKVEVKLTL